MAELPNLAGVATKDLVDTIGSGRFQASYINWARTINLLHEHAPGWMVNYVANPDGGLVHRAPVGGYLLIGFIHTDGTATPAVPQAIMDHKNNSIAYDKISARDITDTQRRGMCMAAAMTFGLTYELWAKDKLEEAYSRGTEETPAAPKPATAPQAPSAEVAKASEPTETSFREAALEKGFTTHAIEGLLGIINGDYAKGVSTVGRKTAEEVEALNAKFAPKSGKPEKW